MHRTGTHRTGTIDEQLAQTELCRGLSVNQRREVADHATWMEMPAGTVLTREGKAGAEFIIVLRGSVEIRVAGVAVATRGPGEVLGEISLLEACMRTATAVATTPVFVGVMSKRDFWNLLGGVPAVQAMLMATAAVRRSPVASQ
jgi:CRP/FNR family cyclic AMP-dependent transcriptional regulator